MLPKHMTLSLARAESAKDVPCGRMNPFRRRGFELESDGCEPEETDRLEMVEGADAERSREGQAPKASDGETLGEGESGRSRGDVAAMLGGGLRLSMLSCRVETIGVSWLARCVVTSVRARGGVREVVKTAKCRVP